MKISYWEIFWTSLLLKACALRFLCIPQKTLFAKQRQKYGQQIYTCWKMQSGIKRTTEKRARIRKIAVKCLLCPPPLSPTCCSLAAVWGAREAARFTGRLQWSSLAFFYAGTQGRIFEQGKSLSIFCCNSMAVRSAAGETIQPLRLLGEWKHERRAHAFFSIKSIQGSYRARGLIWNKYIIL